MLKKFLSAMLISSIILSSSVTTFATEYNGGRESIMMPENVEFVDETKLKSLPEMEIGDLDKDSSLLSPKTMSYLNRNVNEGIELNAPLNYVTTKSVTQSWTGTLPNQGNFAHIAVSLAPTQILNSTLICPQNANLNYDLFVYEMDDNGYLGNLVAESSTGTYFNTYKDGTTKTVDEGAGFINNTSTTNTYAVIVSATQGGSATDTFKLTISLDVLGNYDAAEPNDSAYNAYAVSEGTVSGANLHVINDQDWYIWRATSEFKAAKVESSDGYKTEVYTANQNKLVLTKQNTDGSYPIATGVNYIRVFSDESSFIPSKYSLSIIPTELTPAKMEVELDGDEGVGSYPSYPQGEYFRFKDNLSPKVIIKSVSGYPVSNQPVKLYWESDSWNEHTGNKTREVEGITDNNGRVTLVLEKPNLPIALGNFSYTIPGPKLITHYYDIDLIKISSKGVESFISPVYHFSRSEY